MTKEKIEDLMHLSIIQLMEIAKTPEGFAQVLSCAVNMGIAIGTRQAHEATNKAFRGYSESLIKN
jgi:ribosomal protein S26